MKIKIDETGKLTGVFLESKGNIPDDAIDVSDEIGSALSTDQEYARYINGEVTYLERPSDESIAFQILRSERNVKLEQTDWRASSDLTLSSEWSSYRQALRDLPSTANPTLDSDGNLQGVTWPDEPT